MAKEDDNFDPFEKEKRIRAGNLDGEMPHFEELTGWLQRVPMTWLPGLLIACVDQCVIQDVFQEGRLLELVKAAEERAKDPTSILRNTSSPATGAGVTVVAGESAPAGMTITEDIRELRKLIDRAKTVGETYKQMPFINDRARGGMLMQDSENAALSLGRIEAAIAKAIGK